MGVEVIVERKISKAVFRKRSLHGVDFSALILADIS